MSCNRIDLPLDERNLSHVLTALSFAGLAAKAAGVSTTSQCWWSDDGFVISTPTDQATLLAKADGLARSLRWVPALGKVHEGVIAAECMLGINPVASLAGADDERSAFKTFAGRLRPALDLLPKQVAVLAPPLADESTRWLLQTARGVSSWGWDSCVGSHNYDLGISSDAEGTADFDPIHPAIELLALAGAAFFAPAQVLQVGDSKIDYSIWTHAISTQLAPLAIARRIDGLPGRRYQTASRGASYGKGGAYRYFPESVIAPREPHEENHND
jgi:hypothetical protein